MRSIQAVREHRTHTVHAVIESEPAVNAYDVIEARRMVERWSRDALRYLDEGEYHEAEHAFQSAARWTDRLATLQRRYVRGE